jgi:hypothetical protein
MGVSTWDPETGWDTPDTSGDFDKSRHWNPGDSEIGSRQPTHREYDSRDRGPDVGLQIVPVTPDKDKEKDRGWQPGWNIEDVIRNGTRTPVRKPDIN